MYVTGQFYGRDTIPQYALLPHIEDVEGVEGTNMANKEEVGDVTPHLPHNYP